MDLMDDVDDTLSAISSSSPPPPSSSSSLSLSSSKPRENDKVTNTIAYFKNCEFCVRGESDGFILQVFSYIINRNIFLYIYIYIYIINDKVTNTIAYFKNCEFCVRGESDGFILQVFSYIFFIFFSEEFYILSQ